GALRIDAGDDLATRATDDTRRSDHERKFLTIQGEVLAGMTIDQQAGHAIRAHDPRQVRREIVLIDRPLLRHGADGCGIDAAEWMRWRHGITPSARWRGPLHEPCGQPPR